MCYFCHKFTGSFDTVAAHEQQCAAKLETETIVTADEIVEALNNKLEEQSEEQAEAPVESVDPVTVIKSAITTIYEQYRKSQVKKLTQLFKKHVGNELELYLTICDRFGVTPEPSLEGVAPQEPLPLDDLARATIEPSVGQGLPNSSTVEVIPAPSEEPATATIEDGQAWEQIKEGWKLLGIPNAARQVEEAARQKQAAQLGADMDMRTQLKRAAPNAITIWDIAASADFSSLVSDSGGCEITDVAKRAISLEQLRKFVGHIIWRFEVMEETWDRYPVDGHNLTLVDEVHSTKRIAL